MALLLAADTDKRYLYAAVDGSVHVFDIDEGHKLVKKIPSPLKGIHGVCANASTAKLYVSAGSKMCCIDLVTDQLLWEKTYAGADRMALTPDGKNIYLPGNNSTWQVVDAASGDVVAKIRGKGRAHNTLCGADGARVYLAAQEFTFLSVADTKSNEIVKQIGPFSDSIRPFTVNAAETLCFVNVNGLLGFEIGDIASGKVLHRVEVQGFPIKDSHRGTPSHGIGLTPDEKEIWVIDGGGYLHVFDVTSLPPKQIADVKLSGSPGWVNFSLDGRFAYPSTGDVIDAPSRKIVATVSKSEKLLQIDFRDGKPLRAGDQFGVGQKRR